MSLMGMNCGGGYLHDESGELWVLEQLRRRARPDRPLVVFDVGANHGQYASSAVRILGDSARVYSFEASPGAFEKLRQNLGGEPSVVLCDYGLSDRDGVATLFSNDSGSMISSLFHRRYEDQDVHPTETCRLRTLDDVCREQGVTRIDHLKLDVEGSELKVLHGAEGMLKAGAVDQIQFEFGEAQVDSRSFLRDFFDLLGPGFRIHRILRRGLWPLPDYDVLREIYRTTNYLAVRRPATNAPGRGA
jgi:FkbM family methyltransferase